MTSNHQSTDHEEAMSQATVRAIALGAIRSTPPSRSEDALPACQPETQVGSSKPETGSSPTATCCLAALQPGVCCGYDSPEEQLARACCRVPRRQGKDALDRLMELAEALEPEEWLARLSAQSRP